MRSFSVHVCAKMLTAPQSFYNYRWWQATARLGTPCRSEPSRDWIMVTRDKLPEAPNRGRSGAAAAARRQFGLGGQAMNNGHTINELEERIAVRRQNIVELVEQCSRSLRCRR